MQLFKNTALCLICEAWGATTMCRESKGDDETIKFEKRWVKT